MERLLISLPVLIFSVVLHEVAHAWVARREGDNTAFMLGRITLNPIPHLDPIGSVLVPGILAITGTGFIFGWAKPVPVNPRNFRNYKRGDILVSLAGVAVNFILAILFTAVLALTLMGARAVPGLAPTWELLLEMAYFGVGINLILVVFNLIPVPPLDGSHVFYHLLPPHLGMRYRQIGGYGMLILIALIFLGVLDFIFLPAYWGTQISLAFAHAVAGV